MRNDQLIRQWRLLSLLDTPVGRTQHYLASELSCSIRTIQRDIEALTIAGFPITHDMRGHEYYWRLLPGFAKSGIPLTVTELLALSACRNFYSLLPIEPLRLAYESAIDKVETALPAAKTLKTLTSYARGLKDYSAHWEHFRLMTEAIRNRTSLSIGYYSYGKKELSIRKVDPYDLWHSQQTIYLIAYCHLRDDLRLFALERIQNVESTEETFQIRSEYSLEGFLGNRFRVMHEDETVTIRVRFSHSVADYVKDRVWHPNQKIESDNGSIILTFDASGTTEILNWVLGYGANAEILEPQFLRDRAAKAIENMNQLYTKSMKRPAERHLPATTVRKKFRVRAKTAT